MKKARKTSYIAYKNKCVPFIRLSGKWLEELGFNVGSNFMLVKENNKLTLSLINSEPINNSLNSNKE